MLKNVSAARTSFTLTSPDLFLSYWSNTVLAYSMNNKSLSLMPLAAAAVDVTNPDFLPAEPCMSMVTSEAFPASTAVFLYCSSNCASEAPPSFIIAFAFSPEPLRPVSFASLAVSTSRENCTMPNSTAATMQRQVSTLKLSASHICWEPSGKDRYTELLKVRMMSTGMIARAARAGATAGSTQNWMYATSRKRIAGMMTWLTRNVGFRAYGIVR
mmetsp:Transcript_4794/g.13982  ORF Transcript_4794/g.13982 Transcript_4794/m.13982 type:complete len:214 (+) Transcript_4794:458-1099(+)